MSSDKKLVTEEQLLLKDVFLIKIYQDNLTDYSGEVVFLPNFAKDLEYISGNNISLMKNETLFDSLLMERLAIENTNVFDYLYESYMRAKDQKQKSWNIDNPGNQAFIDYCIQITQNFAHLFCSTPEIFPDKYPEPRFDSLEDPVKHTAARIVYLLEMGSEEDFVNGIISKFDAGEQEQIATNIITEILKDHQKRSINEDKCIRNVQNLTKLLTIDMFKKCFVSLKEFPWIPGPNNINLTKGVGSATGQLLESSSPLGILMQPSYLQPRMNNLSDRQGYEKFIEKIAGEIRKPKRRAAHEQMLKSFQGLQQEYSSNLSDLFKVLLKPVKNSMIDYKDETMRWFSAMIVGNISRGKLGMRLHKQNKSLMYSSSDAFCLNAFEVMLEICLKFLDRDSKLLEKIDPTYYQYGWRFEYKETGMVNKNEVEVEKGDMNQKSPQDYGTVTEFFFHCLEFAHLCYVPLLQSMTDTMEQIQRLNEQKDALQNHPQISMIQQELEYLEKLFLTYKAVLLDDKRNQKVNALYDTLMHLLLRWNGFENAEINGINLKHIKPKSFMKYVPEHWINDLFEFHFFFLRFKEDYGKSLSAEYRKGNNLFSNLVTFMCIILCENDMISNPYTKAQVLEIVSFIGRENDTVREVYENNVVANKILTAVLLKFYIDIEFTGASDQFYKKYKYRHYASQIFKKIWKSKTYQDQYSQLAKSELNERFTNMVMNDATYCLDEGIEYMEKYMELKQKLDSGQQLSPEEQKSIEQSEGIAGSCFLQVREGLEMMAQISSWAPESFFFGDFKRRIAQLLNYTLIKVLDPRYLKVKVKGENRLNFKPPKLLRDIITTYVNLSHDKEFCQEVTKDERSYRVDEMLRAIKKARADRQLSEEVIGKFEEFLNKTQDITVETQDLAEKLGEIPDEFLDPISCDLMKDPVLLPTSGNIMERSTIKQHLLNDEHDPFNRAPLKATDLVEQPELKKKIETWIQQKLSGALDKKEENKMIPEESKDGNDEEGEEIQKNDLFYQKKNF